MRKTIALFLLLLLCQNLSAAQLPNDFDAIYSMQKHGTTIAEMKLTLRRANNIIHYESHSKAIGLLALFSNDRIDEISQLQWDEKHAHARLQNYRLTRKNKSQKNQHFTLRRDAQNKITASGTYAGKTFSLHPPNLIWDRLSVQLALAADLKATNKIQARYSYNIIDKGRITQYHFEYARDEIVYVGNTQYNAIKIKRPHASGKRTTYLWLARELDFLPIKVEQYRKGELHMSMVLNKFISREPLIKS
jgi:hypothetical protein